MLLAIIAFIPFSLIIYGITLISTKLIVTENNDVEQKDKEEDNIYFENRLTARLIFSAYYI